MQQFVKVPWDQYTLSSNDGFMDGATYGNPSNETETRKQMQSQHSQLQNYINTTVKNAIESLQTSVSNVWSTVYPVGSIYMSVGETSPATLFGGTWVKLENKFLLGSGTRAIGGTGGEETHTLTVGEMPNHNHTIEDTVATVRVTPGGTHNARLNTIVTKSTSYVGGGGAHNNMPPYLVVNMWKRTA